MTDSNRLARVEGDIIRRRMYYTDYREVSRLVEQLEEQGAFEHQSPRKTDERGTYVVISYRDPMVVSQEAAPVRAALVPATRSQQVVRRLPQHPTPAARPIYQRWWFIPSVLLGILAALFTFVYWLIQQIAAASLPNIGVGLVGFAFIVLLVVWAVKNSGGPRGGSSGSHGFHWTPCD
jgi:hypothetical protein